MKKMSPELIRIIVSALLFVIGICFNNNIYIFSIFMFLSYLNVGYEVYYNAFKNLKKREIFDENFLMIIATIGAFCIGEFIEAAVVMILFQFGEFLSDLSIEKSKKSIVELMNIKSEKIHLLNNGKISTIDVKKAKIGDFFIVKPGEIIPLDGIVVDGYSSVDTSSLTGESMPKTIKPSYKVLSGTINLTSIITIKATSNYVNSTSSRIIELIENSNERKANAEKFITKFAKIYTPIVVAIAILLVIIPTLFLKQDFVVWLYRALEVLVISCPCALVISIPLAFFCAIGRASKEGILIKGSKELEYLTKINAVVLDKTGTITKGSFEVSKIVSINTISNAKLLEVAAYAESYSNHPIAKSILAKYGKKVDQYDVSDYKEYPGFGVECVIDNQVIYVGNHYMLEKHNIIAMETNNQIGTIIYVATEEKCLGYLVIEDVIKKEAFTLKKDLSALGILKLIMLSGDDITIVSRVSKQIGINEYYGNLLPIDKVNKVKDINKTYYTAFVGDGINDAPVIKIADIGISMGGIGSDAAIEASDIVLMRDDLGNIGKAISIAKKTKILVIFNIVFSLLFKLIMMILAIIGVSSMWVAVFADVGVTLILVLNSMTLMKRRI